MDTLHFEYTLFPNITDTDSVKSCSCSPRAVEIALKVLAGMIGTACVVVGSLAGKGIIVLGTAAASVLAAKILIPVGCVILVVLLVKVIYDALKNRGDRVIPFNPQNSNIDPNSLSDMI